MGQANSKDLRVLIQDKNSIGGVSLNSLYRYFVSDKSPTKIVLYTCFAIQIGLGYSLNVPIHQTLLYCIFLQMVWTICDRVFDFRRKE